MISEARALQIAEQALKGLDHAARPYEIGRGEGCWLVATSVMAGLHYGVRIDDLTGETTVEAYQHAVIKEQF